MPPAAACCRWSEKGTSFAKLVLPTIPAEAPGLASALQQRLQCREGETVHVPPHCVAQRAWYGDPAHEFAIGHMLGKDVTAEVQQGVVHANNVALNGDPCPGHPKVLIVIVKGRHEPVEKSAAPETALHVRTAAERPVAANPLQLWLVSNNLEDVPVLFEELSKMVDTPEEIPDLKNSDITDLLKALELRGVKKAKLNRILNALQANRPSNVCMLSFRPLIPLSRCSDMPHLALQFNQDYLGTLVPARHSSSIQVRAGCPETS